MLPNINYFNSSMSNYDFLKRGTPISENNSNVQSNTE